MGLSRGGKQTTSSYRRLDVRWLQKNGYIGSCCERFVRWSINGDETGSIVVRAEAGGVVLKYRHRSRGEDWQSAEYRISIDWTPCHYGGKRAWFRCPISGCGRRVAILYGGAIFACRRCHHLAYECQQETPHGRALLKAQSIRMRLGGSGSMAEPFPPKPRKMHRKTYYKLAHQEAMATSRSWPPWLLRNIL
jgi:hypothetical protein